MCGRFAQYSDPQALARRFGVDEATIRAETGPRCYNLAPSAHILAVRLDATGQRELVRLVWGLLPSWSAAPKTGYSTINARAETLDTKPAFHAAFRHRRCLIPADGWYEWQAVSGQKYK